MKENEKYLEDELKVAREHEKRMVDE